MHKKTFSQSKYQKFLECLRKMCLMVGKRTFNEVYLFVEGRGSRVPCRGSRVPCQGFFFFFSIFLIKKCGVVVVV